MRDVFISHSSLDKEIAEEICQQLEQRQLECWLSSRKKDLPPGCDYPDQIRKAIDFSKIFVVLLSRNSIKSGQVSQEITLANDRQRFGMKIFPLIIDDEIDMEDIHHFAGYVLEGKETANWKRQEDRQAFFQQIILQLSNNASNEVAKIISRIPEYGKIIGRDDELKSIADMLKKNGRVCLTGLGGIGKSALAQEYCRLEQERGRYKNIIYLPVEKCLLRTFGNDSMLMLESSNLKKMKQTLSGYEYALYKLSLLENSVNQDTLIVLDNFENVDQDPLFERVRALPCDLLIATRYHCEAFAAFAPIIIEELNSIDLVHNLFELYYGMRLPDYEYVALDQLLADIKYHTMTVMLLAKQMRYFGKKPSDYKNRNQLRTERINNLAQIMSSSMNDSDIAAMYIQLFDLFDASTLSRDERRVMKTMCILPTEGLYKHLYIQLIGDHCVSAVDKLEKTGWIQSSNDRNIIMLHPVVRDVVMHEFELHLEDPDISAFIDHFIKMISNSWTDSYEENTKFKELALSIYYQFPSPTRTKYKDYLILSKLLRILDCMDIGLEIQNKVKMLFVDENGKRMNSAEEAEAFLQIGFTYQDKGDYAGAAGELENAAKIYGNKYAAALSHLAQAYTTIGEKPLDKIESLHRESLSIREKYWKDSISEAAACHLYAKTLSAYNQKLDLAIKLEKRAYEIFTKLQPGGINVSSSAYILGWLYVQTAEDDDDIQYGLEKLEEAKEIRSRHRGGPLHSWMEDIYLKLGMAYEEAHNDQKAREYYELLLKVRTNKYSNNPSHKKLIEAYKLLQDLYKRIGEKEGEKKCRKYLRYHG